jgi:hypothetical protein
MTLCSKSWMLLLVYRTTILTEKIIKVLFGGRGGERNKEKIEKDEGCT